MSGEVQALFMVGAAGGEPPVSVCTPDEYYTCGPDLEDWDKVVLLLSFDEADGTLVLVDSSSYADNRTLTAGQGSAISTGSSKFGTGSLKCTYANPLGTSWTDTRFQLLSGRPSTIEGWFRKVTAQNFTSSPVIFRLSNQFGTQLITLTQYSTGNNVGWRWGFDPDEQFAYTPESDGYVHWAITHDGNQTLKVYLNGVVVRTLSDGAYGLGSVVASWTVYVGGVGSVTTNPIEFYIDEFRFWNGKLVYTGNFTPPTAAFPRDTSDTSGWMQADPRTVLSIHADTDVADPVINFPLTSAPVDTIAPSATITYNDAGAVSFGVGGATFVVDGTNNSIIVEQAKVRHDTYYGTLVASMTVSDLVGGSGTGDTIRFFVMGGGIRQYGFAFRMISGVKTLLLYADDNSSQITTYGPMPASAKYAIKFVGISTVQWFIDDELVRTYNGTAAMGAAFMYFGPVNGDAAGVTLIMCKDLSITQLRTEDDSCYQTKTITLTGIASISAAESQFGGKSILVPNAGTSTPNGAVVTDHADFDFGTSDFTIDLWAYRIANTYVGTLFYGTLGGGEFSVAVGTDGLIDLLYRNSSGSQSFTNVATWPVGEWVYFVTQRRGTNWETYLNGALIHSAAITGGAGSTVDSTGDLFFGRTNVSTAQSWNGYLDDIRVTRGAARYTADFTPPLITFCESEDPVVVNPIPGEEPLRGVSATCALGTIKVAGSSTSLTSVSATGAVGSIVPIAAGAPFPDLKGNITDNFGTLQLDAPITVWHEFRTDGTIYRIIFDATSTVSTTQVGTWIDNTNPNYAIPTIVDRYTFFASAIKGSTGTFNTANNPSATVILRTISGLGAVASSTFEVTIQVLPTASNPRFGESGYFTSFKSNFILSQPAPVTVPAYPDLISTAYGPQTYQASVPASAYIDFMEDGRVLFFSLAANEIPDFEGRWIQTSAYYSIPNIFSTYSFSSTHWNVLTPGGGVWRRVRIDYGLNTTFTQTIVPNSTNPRFNEAGYIGTHAFTLQLVGLI